MTNIAVLGIGFMGFPMAKRLCEAGHTVHAWSRTKEKAERLSAFGAVIHNTPVDAVKSADVVITLLSGGSIVDDVLFASGAARAMQPNTLVIDMSSIQPKEACDHAARLHELNIAHLDAPVSGGTLGAEQGKLSIMVGGDEKDFDRAQTVFTHLGRSTHVGPHGAGQLTKLANQMIVGITIGAVAEAFLLCEKGGASMDKVKEAITGGFADSHILHLHGQRMIDRDFAPRGKMSLHLKDMCNATATAQELGFDAPITQLIKRLYNDAVGHSTEDLDHSALFVELARRNGMQ